MLQALIAARDFGLFVARPSGGLAAQLFDRMLREFEAGVHAADQHLFHHNVRKFLVGKRREIEKGRGATRMSGGALSSLSDWAAFIPLT